MADVEFGNSDISAMLAEMESEKSGSNFVSLYWTPKAEGITKIRFLPQLTTFGEKLFYKKQKIHYIGGRPYYCLEQSLKDKNGNFHQAETCPICAKSKKYYEMANGNRNSSEWKNASDLRAKDRYVARVIVRGNKDKEGKDIEYKPEFYEFGQKIYEMIKAALMSGEYGNPFDLKAGRDFNLTKRGQKKNTDYSGSMFSGNPTPIFADGTKLRALLGELPKMDYAQLVEFQSSETLREIVSEYLDNSVDSSSDDFSSNSFSGGSSDKKPELLSANDKVSDDAIFGVNQKSDDADIDDILSQI